MVVELLLLLGDNITKTAQMSVLNHMNELFISQKNSLCEIPIPVRLILRMLIYSKSTECRESVLRYKIIGWDARLSIGGRSCDSTFQMSDLKSYRATQQDAF